MKTFRELREETGGWAFTTSMPNYAQIGHTVRGEVTLWYYDKRRKMIHYADRATSIVHYQIFDPDTYDEVAWGRIEHSSKNISVTTDAESRPDDHAVWSIAFDLKQKYPDYTVFGYGNGGNREMGVFKG